MPVTTSPKKLVLLDFGHGGSDPGAIYTDKTGNRARIIRESAIVRPIGKLLETEINQRGNYIALDVFKATGKQSDDIYWRASKRVTEIVIYDKAHPVWLLLSLHLNSSESASASGLLVCHYNVPKSSQAIYDAIVDSANSDGIDIAGNRVEKIQKRGNLAMLKIPGVNEIPLELGFLSNANDRARLISSETQAKFAGWIANGIEALEGILPLPT
jgi:N-acetylmuramoyl-L-alanine amidase